MDSDNQLLNSLGKTLNCEIKYIAFATVSFHKEYEKNSEIEKSNISIICLGTQKIFFLEGDLGKEKFTITYNFLDSIKETKKNEFELSLIPNTIYLFKANPVARILIATTENRGALIKNFMCFYTLFYMQNKFVVKSLIFEAQKDEKIVAKVAAEKSEKGPLRTLPAPIKFYNFHYIGQRIGDKKNHDLFNLEFKYEVDKSKNDKKNGQQKIFPDTCKISIDISDDIPISNFGVYRDTRDLSYYAYINFFDYMKANKIEHKNFWISKNQIFYKKYNLNEDPCRWEGWTIEARAKITEKYNDYVFVYLRRKFLPPYFDSYQDFRFILIEETESENTDINPKAHLLMELITGSLHSTETFQPVTESKRILQAKIESLIIDEETLFFLQNLSNTKIDLQDIFTEELYELGRKLFWNILNCFKFPDSEFLKKDFQQDMNDHLKKTDLLSKDKSDKYNFLKIIEDMIKLNSSRSSAQEHKKVMVMDTDASSPSPEDETYNIKIESDKEEKNSHDVWKNKVYRYVAYILNGGLFKHKITLETLIKEFIMKNSNTNSDIQDVIKNCINLFDEDKKGVISPSNDLQSVKKISFNEEVMAVILKTGYICKLVTDSNISFKNICTVITLYPTSKILHALHELLIEVYNEEKVGITLDEPNLRSLIKPLLEIFINKDEKEICPSKLILSSKCLILLCGNGGNNPADLYRKKILIEGNIIDKIALYLKHYAFDEKLVLCCLDLFSLIMKEIEVPIEDKLYHNNDLSLYPILKDFLSNSKKKKLPGFFYSQRLIIKVSTIFLNLTNIVEVNIKKNVADELDRDNNTLNNLIDLVDPRTRSQFIDSKEEVSYVMEYKIFWLLCVLVFKNKTVISFLFKSKRIKEFIERKSDKYLEILLAKNIEKNVPSNKRKAIYRSISKFYEFIYYMLLEEREEIKIFNENYVSDLKNKFNRLMDELEENGANKLSNDDDDSLLKFIHFLKKLYSKHDYKLN